MPIEHFNDSPGSEHASFRPLRDQLNRQDRRRKGYPEVPYGNRFFVYWVDDRGCIFFSKRDQDHAVVQFVRRTGESVMHPELEARGYMLVHKACKSQKELDAIRAHILDHEARVFRGRKDRLVFSPPLKDLPTVCLERMVEHRTLPPPQLEEAKQVLQSRFGKNTGDNRSDGKAKSQKA